jgi:hypothetical protein
MARGPFVAGVARAAMIRQDAVADGLRPERRRDQKLTSMPAELFGIPNRGVLRRARLPLTDTLAGRVLRRHE